jgi:hypothetical protein
MTKLRIELFAYYSNYSIHVDQQYLLCFPRSLETPSLVLHLWRGGVSAPFAPRAIIH